MHTDLIKTFLIAIPIYAIAIPIFFYVTRVASKFLPELAGENRVLRAFSSELFICVALYLIALVLF